MNSFKDNYLVIMSNKSEVFPIWDIEEGKQDVIPKHNKKTKEISHKIKIAIKGLRKSESKQIRSPDIHFKKLDNSLWFITIEPRFKQNGSDYYFGLFLHLKCNQLNRFSGETARFKLSLIDTKRGKVWSKSSRQLFFDGHCGWGWKSFAKIDEIFANTKRSLDLNLILCITSIQLQDSNPNESAVNMSCGDSAISLDEFAFTHDLMNDKEYCDIRFVVGDVHFTAHSKLLASKSSVFKRLFSKQKEISITDIDSNVFYELVLFLYKGYSPNIEKYCKKLLCAANYYQIPRLKSICDNLCFRDLSPEEAIDALIFADKYRTFSSRLRTLCFTARHIKQIESISQQNWHKFQTENKCLFNEVLEIADMKCECLHVFTPNI